MFRFSIVAVEQFKSICHEFPYFVALFISIPNVRQQNSDLTLYLEDKLLKSEFDLKLKNNTIKTCPAPVHLTELEKTQITEILQVLVNKKSHPNKNQTGSILFS